MFVLFGFFLLIDALVLSPNTLGVRSGLQFKGPVHTDNCQAHPKLRGGAIVSKHKDILANQKPKNSGYG